MTPTSQPQIIVKFLSRSSRQGPPDLWLRQFPGGVPIWGKCRFVFDPDERRYDWLAAYEDLPKETESRSAQGREPLACAPAHTLLITSEPSSIKQYGRRFTAQFGCVLTSQSAAALPHPGAVRSQPALYWFYGWGRKRMIQFDEMRDHPPLAKSRVISSVASSKKQRLTLHRRRSLFTGELKALLPELEVFGHGVRDMDDKAEALNDFRYHVAVENFVGPHHWTEKLADSFLGCTLPFYFGCPNAAEYFPEGSFIPIDIFDPPGATRIIRAAIENNEYEKRLPLILEARRRVLYEYNTFAVVSRLIEARHSAAVAKHGAVLLSRHALRAASPLNLAADVFDKIRGKLAALRSAR
ncbi:MAG: glycosyltransferase [Pedosphaera sp.]|nr:glycosyltransferase [Pedosphaera sp.]